MLNRRKPLKKIYTSPKYRVRDMIKLVITGGIGSGKTTVLNWFKTKLIPTISSDTIAHELVAKGQPGLTAIVDHFGKEMVDTDGNLKRDYLRNLIFNNLNAKQTLENILHPLIRVETQRQLKSLEQKNHYLVAIEIPLLAETGKPNYIDLVWVIDCSMSTQINRVKQRSKLSTADVLTIINNQATSAARIKIADTVINSDISKLKFYNNLELELSKVIDSHAL